MYITISHSSVHVVFGKVISGHDIITAIEEMPVDKKARPVEPVLISDCGVIPQERHISSDSESDHKKKERKKRKKDKKDKKHKKHKKEKKE